MGEGASTPPWRWLNASLRRASAPLGGFGRAEGRWMGGGSAHPALALVACLVAACVCPAGGMLGRMPNLHRGGNGRGRGASKASLQQAVAALLEETPSRPVTQSAPPDHPDGVNQKRPARRGVGGRGRGGAASCADLVPEQPSQREGAGGQNAARSTDDGLALSPTFRLACSRFTSHEQPSAGSMVDAPHNDGSDAMEDDVPVRELPLVAAEAPVHSAAADQPVPSAPATSAAATSAPATGGMVMGGASAEFSSASLPPAPAASSSGLTDPSDNALSLEGVPGGGGRGGAGEPASEPLHISGAGGGGEDAEMSQSQEERP